MKKKHLVKDVQYEFCSQRKTESSELNAQIVLITISYSGAEVAGVVGQLIEKARDGGAIGRKGKGWGVCCVPKLPRKCTIR